MNFTAACPGYQVATLHRWFYRRCRKWKRMWIPSGSVWNSVKSCRSSWLESQIINIKLKKNQQKFPVLIQKLSALDWRTCGNFQHCHLWELLFVCGELGVPIAPDKTTKPATAITFLGIELDLNARIACLPYDKLSENIELLTLVPTQQNNVRRTLADNPDNVRR